MCNCQTPEVHRQWNKRRNLMPVAMSHLCPAVGSHGNSEVVLLAQEHRTKLPVANLLHNVVNLEYDLL